MSSFLSIILLLLAVFNLLNAYRNHWLAKQLHSGLKMHQRVSQANVVMLNAMDKYEADLDGKSQAIQYVRSELAASLDKHSDN